jgi:hypothetical protein
LCRLADLHLRGLGSVEFGQPVDASLTDQPEQFAAGRNDRTEQRRPRSDEAVVEGADARLRQTQLLVGEARGGGGALSHRAALGGEVLRGLLLGQGFGRTAGAFGVGRRLGQGGLALRQLRPRHRHLGLHAVVGQTGKLLAAFDLGSDIDEQLADAQATGLGRDHHLLPGRQRSVGRHAARPHRLLGPGQGHGQGDWRHGRRRGPPGAHRHHHAHNSGQQQEDADNADGRAHRGSSSDSTWIITSVVWRP